MECWFAVCVCLLFCTQVCYVLAIWTDVPASVQGFRKMPASGTQEFCHPCFKRGQPQLLSQIHRGGMTNMSSQADGPGGEIVSLKGQVDKLSKALSYALAELHRRGFDTLQFNWKELEFVDPSVFPAGETNPHSSFVCENIAISASYCTDRLGLVSTGHTD